MRGTIVHKSIKWAHNVWITADDTLLLSKVQRLAQNVVLMFLSDLITYIFITCLSKSVLLFQGSFLVCKLLDYGYILASSPIILVLVSCACLHWVPHYDRFSWWCQKRWVGHLLLIVCIIRILSGPLDFTRCYGLVAAGHCSGTLAIWGASLAEVVWVANPFVGV